MYSNINVDASVIFMHQSRPRKPLAFSDAGKAFYIWKAHPSWCARSFVRGNRVCSFVFFSDFFGGTVSLSVSFLTRQITPQKWFRALDWSWQWWYLIVDTANKWQVLLSFIFFCFFTPLSVKWSGRAVRSWECHAPDYFPLYFWGKSAADPLARQCCNYWR